MRQTTTALDRFWAKVDKTGECWEWRAAVTHSRSADYGSFWFDGASHPAHRWIYGEHFELVDGSHIDHLCQNTLCVRVDHLEQVTGRTNVLRGTAPSASNARKTHCLRGHELSGNNLRVTGDGRRNCRQCFRASQARYEAKRTRANA